MKIIFTYLLLIISFCSFGQKSTPEDKGYLKGKIIYTNNDTVYCYIRTKKFSEYNSTISNNSFKILKDIKSEPTTVNYNQVKEIEIYFSTYHCFPIQSPRNPMMKLLKKGKINLYEIRVRDFNIAYNNSLDGVVNSNIMTLYYIKTSDFNLINVNKKYFKNELINLIKDCPEVSKKLENKNYKFKDLKKLIEDYNSQSTN